MASVFDKQLTPEKSPARPGPKGVPFFCDTLGRRSDSFCRRHGLSAPICVVVHGAAIGAIAVASLFTHGFELTPSRTHLTRLQFAPPPPRPLKRSGPVMETTVEERSELSNRHTFVPASFITIPEEVLTASFDVDLSDAGVDDGDAWGMVGGLADGVIGGVPGGIVGGLVGGTGTELPHLPKPDVGPRPIRMPKPRYTEAAIREKVRGAVVLRVVINEQGKVEVLKVLRSIPELDAEAIRLVEARWRFEPATRNGRPVPAISDLVVRFNLY